MTDSPTTTLPTSSDTSTTSSGGCESYDGGSLVVCYSRAVEVSRRPDDRPDRWCFHCRARYPHEIVVTAEPPVCGPCERRIYYSTCWLHVDDNLNTCLPETERRGWIVSVDPVLSYYEPNVSTRCTNCGEDHTYFPGCGPL